jgi:hypothetical protein
MEDFCEKLFEAFLLFCMCYMVTVWSDDFSAMKEDINNIHDVLESRK